MKLLLLLLPICAFGFGFLRPNVENIIDKAEDSSQQRLGKLTSEEKAKLSKEWGMDIEERKVRLDRISSKASSIATSKVSFAIKNPIKSFPKVTITKPSEGVITDLFNVNEEAGVSDYLFEGDLHLTESQLDLIESSLTENGRRKRQAAAAAAKWTNNTLYFYFDASIDDEIKSIVRAAQSNIRAHTCIDFVEDQKAENRVKVYKGAGCSSALGMRGGEQLLSLGDYCGSIGSVSHEFSHALGFIHTQSRSDRDTYVDLDLSNVPEDKYKNFVKYPQDQNILLTPYEYGSSLHYSAETGAKGKNGYVITPKDENYIYTLGHRQVSFYDLLMINDYYNCNATCTVENSAVCQNGGYPNPRNCAECNCPSGYGGALCDELPSGCGETLEASSFWQSYSFNVGNAERSRRSNEDFLTCTHWITAPEGKQVRVRMTIMHNVFCDYGCPYNGIEVKSYANPQITNPLYCCKEFINKTITSELNPTPVVAFTRGSNYFEIEYRFVNAEVKPTKKTTPTTTTVTSTSEAKTTTTSASTSTQKTTEKTTSPKGETTTKPNETTSTVENTTTKPIEKPPTTAPVVPPKDCVNPLTFSMIFLKRLINDQIQKHSYISDNFLVNNMVSQGFRAYGQIGKVVDCDVYEDNKAVLEPLCPSLVKLRSFVDTSVFVQFMTVDDNEAQAKIDAGWHEAPSVGYCSTSKSCGANRNLRSVTAFDSGDIIYSTYNKELNDLNSSHNYEGTLSPTICWLF